MVFAVAKTHAKIFTPIYKFYKSLTPPELFLVSFVVKLCVLCGLKKLI